MIEPTETESKDDLDAFVAAVRAVVGEARERPELLRTAPHTMPVKRLDEVAAARNPVFSSVRRRRGPAGRLGVRPPAPSWQARPRGSSSCRLLRASGDEQMAADERLLDGSTSSTVGATCGRRPPCRSASSRSSAPTRAPALAAAGIDVVRRPSGGRLVLHGEGFEWSFAVAFPAVSAALGTHAAYRLVRDAMAAALADGRRDARPGARRALRALGAVLLLGPATRSAGRRGQGGRRGPSAPRRSPARARQRARTAPARRACGRRRGGDRRALARRGPRGDAGAAPDSGALWRAFVEQLAAACSPAEGAGL